jgi:hypothetical protein
MGDQTPADLQNHYATERLDMKLLNRDQNAKTVKGRKLGYATAILYLAPANLSGFEVCPQRSAGCTAACLNTAGRGAFDRTQQTRIARTKWYFEDRPAFLAALVRELSNHMRWCERKGFLPAVRLNGTSDIPWERVRLGDAVGALPGGIAALHDRGFQDAGEATLFDAFPGVQFYDYTKVTKRALAWAAGEMPPNYRLTFSLTENNDTDAVRVLDAKGNIAMVFRIAKNSADKYGRLPRCVNLGPDLRIHPGEAWQRDQPQWPVIDGDENDLRHLDRRGVVVGLKAKGKARHDTSGFVR